MIPKYDDMDLTLLTRRQAELKDLLQMICVDTFFLHSDVFKTNLFIGSSIDRKTILNSHIDLLHGILTGSNLWFPAFNYQFPKIKDYNVQSTVCEVGPLPEHFRKEKAQWRTLDPIFSVCGTGDNPSLTFPRNTITAFDDESIFAKLVNKKAGLLFYGAEFSSATIIHYAERLSIQPYRYDKIFSGSITTNNSSYQVNYIYHVRPMGYRLEYAWCKLLKDLQIEGICSSLTSNIVHVMRADILVQYWMERLSIDPLYFLDEDSKKWVIPKLDKLGRRFELQDFE